MKITVITVGKLKEAYWREATAEYAKRLGRYCSLRRIEVPDERAPETLSESEMAQVREREGARILEKLVDGQYVITLEIEGGMQDSEGFAAKLSELALSGRSDVVFVIGGSLGLSGAVRARSDMALSFSRFTFPHQLMQVVLLEQIYRGFRIMRGEPYHK